MSAVAAFLARRGVLLALVVSTLACIALFQADASPAASAHFIAHTGAPPFDERAQGYRVSDMARALALLGPEGLAQYRAYRLVDVFFPWLLAGLVAAVMVRLQAAVAMPLALLAALADTAENVALYVLLGQGAAISPPLVQWASVLTQLKFAVYTLMLGGLLWGGARHLWRQARARPLR